MSGAGPAPPGDDAPAWLDQMRGGWPPRLRFLLAKGERGALLEAEARELRELAAFWELRLAWRRLDLNGPRQGEWRAVV